MSDLHVNQQAPGYELPLLECQLEKSATATSSTKTGSLFNILGTRKAESSDSLPNRFPAMSALASCIRSLTAGIASAGSTIKDFAWSTYSKIKVSVAQLSINSTNIRAIKTLYGEEIAGTYDNAFLKHGEVQQKSPEQIKSAFEELPPQEKTITFLSKQVISVGDMGYYTNPTGIGLDAAPDAVIPKDGFTRIYGSEERAAMLGTLNNEEKSDEITSQAADIKQKIKKEITSLELSVKAGQAKKSTLEVLQQDTSGYENWQPYQLLAYNKAKLLDWDRVRLEVSGKTVDLSNARFRPAQNLNAFKKAVESVTGNTVSDREAYEMMRLIDQEGLSGGFPKGSDPKTGLAFGQERMTEMEQNVVHLSLAEDKSVLFNYTSARAYLNSITIPPPEGEVSLQTTAKLSELPSKYEGSYKVDRILDTNIPQFELSMKYTYAYTPSATPGAKGNTSLLDSRMAYWRIPASTGDTEGLERSSEGSALSTEATTHESRSSSTGSTNSAGSVSSIFTDVPSASGPLEKGSTSKKLPENIQQEFASILSTKEEINKSQTASTIHQWENARADDPLISEQLYHDIDRGAYFLAHEEGNPVPLFQAQPASEDPKITAAKNFEAFIGDRNQSLAISKIANQQFSFTPLLSLMNTANGPLELPRKGSGLPLGNFAVSHTFSKLKNGNVVMHVQAKQTPMFFAPSPSGSADNISLDPNKSFVNFDYDLTCHFDEQGNLSVTPGPISYNYHLEEGQNKFS